MRRQALRRVTAVDRALPVPESRGRPAVPRILVLADSLAFHGPTQPELLTEPRLFPNVMAADLDAEADIVAQVGWTARHVWRALTRDPRVYSFLVPSADAVVLAVGGMDYLPTALPTHLREGIGYLRPRPLRRGVRRAYLASQPRVARWTQGRLRAMPQYLTDGYLTSCVTALRAVRPGLPIVGVVPPPHLASAFGYEMRGRGSGSAGLRRLAAGAAGQRVVDLSTQNGVSSRTSLTGRPRRAAR